MTKRKPTKLARRAMNPLVTLRAQTIPSKKKVASKRACRGRVQIGD
jgi:hypothetical protein